MISYITLIGVFIACFGLLGLVSFVIMQRTREVGIRKVLGASIPSILSLLSKEFLKWIMAASILSRSISFYFMNKWLQNFAYRTSLSILIFIFSGLAALVIALLSVSWQTIKSAIADPVQSLRYG
jgi:putative ABC transport system permease protein